MSVTPSLLPRQAARVLAVVGALLLLATTLPSAAVAQTATTPPASSASAGSEARSNTTPKADLSDLEDEVMCVQCRRPLVTSAGSAADDQRELMQQWIDEGLTKDQIKARLVDEYGKRALVDDQSAVAAAAPWLAALAGLTSVGLLLRRRRGAGDRADQAGSAEATPTRNGNGPAGDGAPRVSAADDARIDAELAELD